MRGLGTNVHVTVADLHVAAEPVAHHYYGFRCLDGHLGCDITSEYRRQPL